MTAPVLVPAPAEPVRRDRRDGGWADLMREHRADLVRIAQMRLRRDVSGLDAEDVVHEVFLRVVRLGLDPKTVNRPVAYLRQAVANECATRWRRHRELAVEETPDSGQRDHADACAAALTVHKALRQLTPRQRSVIVLGFLQGYTDLEVAATLGVAPVTVRTLRRRGLERLRGVLAEAATDEVPAAARVAAGPVATAGRPGSDADRGGRRDRHAASAGPASYGAARCLPGVGPTRRVAVPEAAPRIPA